MGTKSLDSNAIDFTDSGVNFVGRTSENNGIQGKIRKRVFEPNDPFTITATVIGNYKYVKYQKEAYYCSQNINKLTPKVIFERWNDHIAYYMISSIQKFVSLYDKQQGGYKLEDIRKHIVSLPRKNDKIDYDFIGDFIAELEQARIAELEAYLLVTGLKDYALTDEEQRALNDFEKIKWCEYRIGDLFEKVKTRKLSYKADDLPKEAIGKSVLPCLTSSFRNQGLNYFAPKEGATILKHVISIPSNSDVYRVYFQSREFTVLSDAYAIRCKLNEIEFTSAQYLFIALCINKVTDLPIYSYKNKLGGWNVVQNKHIQIPTKDDKPDFSVMDNFISAIQKLVIKDVVLYADTKVNATQKVVNNQTD